MNNNEREGDKLPEQSNEGRSHENSPSNNVRSLLSTPISPQIQLHRNKASASPNSFNWIHSPPKIANGNMLLFESSNKSLNELTETSEEKRACQLIKKERSRRFTAGKNHTGNLCLFESSNRSVSQTPLDNKKSNKEIADQTSKNIFSDVENYIPVEQYHYGGVIKMGVRTRFRRWFFSLFVWKT